MEKFMQAYFPNKTDLDAIRRGNIAMLSDLRVNDNVLKAVVYQANANNKAIDRARHKNTFFFRYFRCYIYIWLILSSNRRIIIPFKQVFSVYRFKFNYIETWNEI